MFTKKTNSCVGVILALFLIPTSFSFAGTDNASAISLPSSHSQDIVINADSIVRAINDIDDSTKKEMIKRFYEEPLFWEIKEYEKPEDIKARIKEISDHNEVVAEQIAVLAQLSINQLTTTLNDRLLFIAQESLMDDKKIPTQNLIALLKEKKYTILALNLEQKLSRTCDNAIQMPLDIDTRSIQHYYYAKSIELSSGINISILGTCEVNWKFDDNTNKITSLTPNTTFIYNGVGGTLLVYTHWVKNRQYLNSSSTRGYVQKARAIEALAPSGGSVPVYKMVWNIVFSPTAPRPLKTLLNDYGLLYYNDLVDWGGGY